MKIGERIAAARQKKGFTQEYVAEMLGVSRQAVSKWETGQSAPDTKNLIALAVLLEVTVDHLASGSSVPEPHRSPSPVLRWVGIGLFLLSLGLYLFGMFSGEYDRHVMIPISDSVGIGIPFMYYGRSDTAVILLILQSVTNLLAVLMGVIHWTMKRMGK